MDFGTRVFNEVVDVEFGVRFLVGDIAAEEPFDAPHAAATVITETASVDELALTSTRGTGVDDVTASACTGTDVNFVFVVLVSVVVVVFVVLVFVVSVSNVVLNFSVVRLTSADANSFVDDFFSPIKVELFIRGRS